MSWSRTRLQVPHAGEGTESDSWQVPPPSERSNPALANALFGDMASPSSGAAGAPAEAAGGESPFTFVGSEPVTEQEAMSVEEDPLMAEPPSQRLPPELPSEPVPATFDPADEGMDSLFSKAEEITVQDPSFPEPEPAVSPVSPVEEPAPETEDDLLRMEEEVRREAAERRRRKQEVTEAPAVEPVEAPASSESFVVPAEEAFSLSEGPRRWMDRAQPR